MDTHRLVFRLIQMRMDGVRLDQGQQALVEEHLGACEVCRTDQRLIDTLQAETYAYMEARTAMVLGSQTQLIRKPASRAVKGMTAFQLAGWAILAAAVVLLIQWAYGNLRPGMKTIPAGEVPAPTDTATKRSENPAAMMAQLLLEGTKAGEILWSPDGKYAFIEVLAPQAPGGDRRTSSLHFIDGKSGEDCPAPLVIPGPQAYSNAAWLEDTQLVYIDGQGGANILTPCDTEIRQILAPGQDPIQRVALGLPSTEGKPSRYLLLEGESHYWILDSQKLDFRQLDTLTPSPDMADTYAYRPGSPTAGILQPVSQEPAVTRLALVNLDSGTVQQEIYLDTGDAMGRVSAEWLGADTLMVWALDPSGPIAVDFSGEAPKLTRVIPEWLGLDIVYPDEVAATGVYYWQEEHATHLILHVNKDDDKSIYIYHSESGQVEYIASQQPVLLILPGGEDVRLVNLDLEPYFEEGYQLVWVDQPERPLLYLPLAGHMPRSYYRLNTLVLPGKARLAAASSQGVSLVSLENGETLDFWKLTDAEPAYITGLTASPDGSGLIVSVGITSEREGSQDAVYWIPLPQ